jgi:hypothetical protein
MSDSDSPNHGKSESVTFKHYAAAVYVTVVYLLNQSFPKINKLFITHKRSFHL